VPTIRGILNRARELVIDGELAHARGLCEQVLARYPKHAEAHVLLGEAAREAGQFEEARKLFLDALAFDPENSIGYWALGLIAEREDQPDVAASMLERALEYLPGDADLWESIRKIRGRPPEMSTAGLGRAYLRQGLFYRARRELEAALANEPSRVDLRLALAECLWRMGLIAEARTRCEEVIESSPDCLKALLLLADCCRQQRRLAAAERLLRRASQVDPDGDLAAGLFIDSDPPWITRDPIELDAAPIVEEPADNRPEPATWIERLARQAEPPPEPPEPRLSDWFGDSIDETVVEAVEETLFDNESFAPWHDLLTVEATIPADVQKRLRDTLSDLTPMPSEYGDGWHAVTLKARSTDASGAETREGPGVLAGDDAQLNAPDQRAVDPLEVVVEERLDSHERLERARRRQATGDWIGSLADWRILLSTAPELASDAVDSLRALVASRPDDMEARRALAEACSMTGRFLEAIDAFARVDEAKFAIPTPVS